jgi:hypothetical protein
VAVCKDSAADQLSALVVAHISMTYPDPTPEELKTLRIIVEDWDTRTPIQAALALAVLRGYDNYQAASDYLGATIPELEEAKKSLWGILYDGNTGKLWVK